MVAVKQKFEYLPDGNVDVAAWFEKIIAKHTLTEIDLLQKSVTLAQGSTKGLTTFYGQPCLEQSLEMAEILLDMRLDQDTVAAAIMTSPIQHTSLPLEKINTELNDSVANLVNSVLQMNALNNLQITANKSRDQTQLDRLRKTFLAMVSDIRVVLIKLAERTCIMRGIKNINTIERQRIAQETIDIYAPLANRLGIGQLKWELEDIAFHYSHPDIYKTIAKFLAERRADREQRIHKIMSLLKEHLSAAGIKTTISGRAKHIYSIYLKMQKKHLDYKNIYDCSAIRILVNTLEECYTTLSIVHNLFEHIPEEFDDYITNPKPNGYRSIHTAVVDEDGKNLEIQIRTRAMHDEAEHGVAAHWLYKENKAHQSGYEAKITFLRQLLAWHKDVAGQSTAPDKTLADLEDRVYIFTPAGKIIDLPMGATPLDFAYHIHSEIGHRCRGAKINGHIVPLTYTLQTGNQVEIITAPHGTPSRDWLSKETGYLKTSRARAKVAHWFKQQDITQYIEEGKNNLERELARAGISQPNFEKIASRFHYKDDAALFAAIGHGNVRVSHIIQALQTEQPVSEPAKIPNFTQSRTPSGNQTGLQIAGLNDLLMRIARCCKPIPGDNIIGFITQGRGVSIHRANCSNIASYIKHQDHRLIAVDWNNQASFYYVDLRVRISGQDNLMKEMSAIITNAKLNLIALNSVLNRKNNLVTVMISIQIQDVEQLKHLLQQLSQLPRVIDVKRMSE